MYMSENDVAHRNHAVFCINLTHRRRCGGDVMLTTNPEDRALVDTQRCTLALPALETASGVRNWAVLDTANRQLRHTARPCFPSRLPWRECLSVREIVVRQLRALVAEGPRRTAYIVRLGPRYSLGRDVSWSFFAV
jgi:hypothetical protein